MFKTRKRLGTPPVRGEARRWGKQPSNEDLGQALRDSLAASTPSPHGGYREGPPSSNASSADHTEPDDSPDLDDEDVVVPPTEWEGWIDWDHLDTMQPRLKRMAIRG